MTFEELCAMLPADINWGDPITPLIVEEIAMACREHKKPDRTTPVIRLSPTPNTSMNVEQVLHSVLADVENGCGMQDMLIIGYDVDGALYIRSSKMTCAEAFFMANKAMRWAESGGEA